MAGPLPTPRLPHGPHPPSSSPALAPAIPITACTKPVSSGISVTSVTNPLAVLAVLSAFRAGLGKRTLRPLAVLAAFTHLAAFHVGPPAHNPSTRAEIGKMANRMVFAWRLGSLPQLGSRIPPLPALATFHAALTKTARTSRLACRSWPLSPTPRPPARPGAAGPAARARGVRRPAAGPRRPGARAAPRRPAGAPARRPARRRPRAGTAARAPRPPA